MGAAVRLLGVPCWIVPVSAGMVWLVTLLLLIICWAATGSRRYPEMFTQQEWPYISNTGATTWGKPIFIAGSTITALFLCSTFGLERWFRRRGRLIHHESKWTAGLFVASAICTSIGSIALVLLTIFDVRHYSSIHYPLVATFLFGYLLAACFVCIERKLLSLQYPSNRIIRFSFRIKLIFVAVEIVLVCLFAATMYQKIYGLSVIVEWIVGLFFTFYMWTFAFDFYSVPRKSRELRQLRIRHWDDGGVVTAPRQARVRFAVDGYTELA